MILPILSSLIYSSKRRIVVEVVPPSFKILWNKWDLRVMVVLSLLFQITLIILGHRRKYKRSLLIRAVVWSAYLAADSTAMFALGIISNNLIEIYGEGARSLNASTQLTALWAPFLLLHLGGPDTITAYSLEDNELWLRHLLGLVSQAIVTFYVFLLAWTGSPLSILFILLFFAGLIKYGERNYVFRSASDEKLRESIYTPFSSTTNTFMFNWLGQIKERAGKSTRKVVVPDNQLSVDLSIFTSNDSISNEDKLITADGFLQGITKRYFLDILISSRDKDRALAVFRNMTLKDSFKVVEMELGLIYDLLYTKAPLLCTRWGLALRGITFFLICCALVVFTTFLDHEKTSYPKIDLTITLLLLIIAVILEVYSALLFLLSDQFFIWLSKHKGANCSFILQAVAPFRLSKKRWSHQMCEWSLLRSFITEKPLPCLTILKLLKLDKKLAKRPSVKVRKGIKDLIFRYMKKKLSRDADEDMDIPFVVIPTAKGETRSAMWIGRTNVNELGINILFWHIVTEVSYNLDQGKKQFEDIVEHCKLIKHISRYMGYLLLKYPSLLSVGADKISLHKTIEQAIDVLREAADGIREDDQTGKKLQHRLKKIQAYEELVELKSSGEESSQEGRNMLLSALGFANSIRYEEDLTEKWNKIGCIWLKILFLAAKRSKGKEHAQQLRRGGELFTHVWLLMAHFGLTSHFEELRKQKELMERNPNIDGVIAK